MNNTEPKMTLLKKMEALDKDILKSAKAYDAAKTDATKTAHLSALKNAISEYIIYVGTAVHKGYIKSDPSGLCHADSIYKEKYPFVDDVAKEVLASLGENPEMTNEAAAGIAKSFKFSKAYKRIKDAVVVGTVTGYLVFTSTIVRAYRWIKGKIVSIGQWVIAKVKQFWDFLKALFSTKEEVLVPEVVD